MIGNIYPRRGPGPSDIWIVISQKSDGMCICLGLDSEGNIVSAQHYQPHYLTSKDPIGRINVEELRFYDDSRSEQSPREGDVGSQENGQDVCDPASWPVRVVS
ncbi:MAG: hypothetical protein CMB99_15600 [Flavobacteriaceae bacterium]|nr:hypothetical protein [Flavobacteriaceae bacterium]